MITDEYESIGTHWIALYINADNVTYFDSFGVKRIPKWIRKFIGNRNIIIYLLDTIIQLNNRVEFCVRFIEFMLDSKSLSEYIDLFFPQVYKDFQWWKSAVIFAINIKNLKTLKYHIF